MIKQQLTKDEIEFLGESNKIEGESGEMGSPAMEDAKKAWNYGKRKNKGKWSIVWLLKIQKIMSNRLAKHYSGFIRECPVYIGGECKSQNKEEIIKQLNDLFNEYKQTKFLKGDIQSKEEYIKDFHIRYEDVHPFCDFNGRSGRILMNLQRVELGLPILIIHEGDEQWEYYKWFKGDR